jgi:hypothetical protein
MDQVKQAFSLSDPIKARAKELYAESVKEMVSKNYAPAVDDAFVDLSALFGVRWVRDRIEQSDSVFDLQLYAEANAAFNYANIYYYKPKAFVALAKSLVPAAARVDDRRLRKYAKQMNCLLTVTTPKAVFDSMQCA